MNYKDALPDPKIQAGISTETRGGAGGGTDPTIDPGPHPAGQIVQDQLAAQGQGTGAGISGAMGGIRQDLHGTTAAGTIGLQHIDYSDDPQFAQIVQGFEQWGRQAGMSPEQFCGMLGQALAQWCWMQGDGHRNGLSALHQCTAFLGTYQTQLTGATGGSGFGNFGASPTTGQTAGKITETIGGGQAG